MSQCWFNKVNLAWTETEGYMHVHDEQGKNVTWIRKKQEQDKRTKDIYLPFDLSSDTHSIQNSDLTRKEK